jgi:hypothetical protein
MNQPQQNNDNRIDFVTPVGRLVGGSPFECQEKDAMGNPLTIKTGPNAGQPTVRYFMALAIEKNNPEVGQLMATMAQVAQQSFPSLFDASGNCVYPNFSWKFDDGDSTTPNKKGIAPSSRQGYPGHWVFKFSGSMPPKVYSAGGVQELTDPNSIKRGYFIRVGGSVKGNGNATNPGLYLNYRGVELAGYGEEIHVGPDPKQMFGSQPTQLPTGASTTPPMSQPSPFAGGGAMPPQGGAMPPMGSAMPPQGGAMPPMGSAMPPQGGAMPPQGGAMPPMGGAMPPQGGAMPPMGGGIQPQSGFMQPQTPQESPDDMFLHQGQQFSRGALTAAGWSVEEIAALQRC